LVEELYGEIRNLFTPRNKRSYEIPGIEVSEVMFGTEHAKEEKKEI
jgi:hypothetical protein